MARGGTGFAESVRLFDRRYRLQVDTLVITGLQVKFEIKRSLNPKTPNSAKIEIANLSEATRQRLQGFGRVFVSLEAGYANGMSLIFRGDLREVSSAREEREWITTVTSGDGEKGRKKKRLNKSYPPGTAMSKILVETARAMGVDMGNAQSAAAKAQLFGAKPAKVLGGFTASGDALSSFDRVCRSCGLEWSIQDNQLQLLPHGQPLSERGPNISTATGLIGSPELGKSGIVKVRTLMIPGLQPGGRVELEGQHVKGIYRIESVSFQGDMWGDEWGAELELKAPADPRVSGTSTSATTATTTATDATQLVDPPFAAYYDALPPGARSVAAPFAKRVRAIIARSPTVTPARYTAIERELSDMDVAVKAWADRGGGFGG